jgi:Rad3-related DNA helicase
MTSVNNLALMLSEVQKQMQNNLNMCSKNKGKSSCSKPGGSGKSSMSNMRKAQEQINKQLKSLKEGLQSGNKSGNGNAMKQGRQGMSEQLARLAAQQEALRNEMQKYLDQLNEQGYKDGGGMSDAIKQMEQTEKDIVNRRILQETIDRQQQILTRMLESEKAEMQREQEEKRKSTEAKNQKYSNPSSNFQYNYLKKQSDELMKSVQPSYNFFYRNKINGYFLKFE